MVRTRKVPDLVIRCVLITVLLCSCSPLRPSGQIPAPAPQSGTIKDVTDYRGSLARTGVLPGPGINGAPVRRWQASLSAPVTYPPVVVDAQVIAPDGTGLVSLDLDTGDRVWTVELGSVVTSPLTVASGVLYATTADRVVHAIDLSTRTERWRIAGAANAAQVSVVGDTAYVGTVGRELVALETLDGSRQWSVRVGHSSGKNAIADGVAYVGGDGDGAVTAVDLRARTIRWRLDTGTVRVATPAVVGKTVYVAGIASGGMSGRGDHLLAVDTATGQRLWRFEPPDDAPMASFAVGGRQVYIGGDTAGGALFAVDRSSGRLAWQARNNGAVDRPVIVGGTVYVGSGRSGLNIYDLATGRHRGHVDVPGYGEGVIVTGGVALLAARSTPDSPGSVTAFAAG